MLGVYFYVSAFQFLLYKGNVLIQEACLLLVEIMVFRNSCVTVASVSSAGLCIVKTVQLLILPEAWR